MQSFFVKKRLEFRENRFFQNDFISDFVVLFGFWYNASFLPNPQKQKIQPKRHTNYKRLKKGHRF